MSPPRLQRLREDQRGAVAFIVAVSLLSLMGFLVLVFDFGRVVGVRRDMVNGADAAAIAAAQQCALQNHSVAAAAAAEDLVVANFADASVSSFSAPECDNLSPTSTGPRLVTVQAQVDIDYYFAQLLGFSNSNTYSTTAVAEWGPAAGVTSPVPIRINQIGLDSCVAAAQTTPPAACNLGFDNSGTVEPSDSQWGILNFPQGWPVDSNNDDCSSNAGGASEDVQYIVPDGTPTSFTAGLLPWANQAPFAAMVCAAPGSLGNDIVSALSVRANSTDPYLTFPVMCQPGTTIPGTTNTCPPVQTTPGNEAFPIVSFVVLKVLGAWHGADARAHCTFPDTVKDKSLFCIQLAWEQDKQLVDAIPGPIAQYPNTTTSVRLVG